MLIDSEFSEKIQTRFVWGAPGELGTPSRQSRAIDPPFAMRRGEGAQMKWCRELRCSPRVRPVCRGILGSHQRCQVPFRTSRRNDGLLLRRCTWKGPHLALTREPSGFSRVAAGFSCYDGHFMLPLVLGQRSPIFHLNCEGELGVVLESLQGKIDLI